MSALQGCEVLHKNRLDKNVRLCTDQGKISLSARSACWCTTVINDSSSDVLRTAAQRIITHVNYLIEIQFNKQESVNILYDQIKYCWGLHLKLLFWLFMLPVQDEMRRASTEPACESLDRCVNVRSCQLMLWKLRCSPSLETHHSLCCSTHMVQPDSFQSKHEKATCAVPNCQYAWTCALNSFVPVQKQKSFEFSYWAAVAG